MRKANNHNYLYESGELSRNRSEKNIVFLHLLCLTFARKEHRCNFCGGVISVGEKYNRQTNVYDGRVYDWVSHCECSELACELDMFDDCDEGLDDDGFIDSLNQYVYDNHYDDKIDDIAKDWQLPRYELVKKVSNELKKGKEE